MSNFFIKKLQNYIFQEKLLEQKDKVIIGISGGPDSIGLVLALKKLQLKYLLKLQLVHVNYHQRGEESNQDEKFVRDFAEKNELELKVIQYSEFLETGNLEEQLRDFRYQKFEEIRKKINFDKVAVAHHLDDQAETFFMNMLRGSGLQGLSGMLNFSGLIIRPFLIFTKKEIKKFLKDNQQKYRIDESNLNLEFTRNKIRAKLIPFLEESFDSKIREKLGKLVSNLQDENQLVNFWVKQNFENLVERKGNGFIWDISKLEKIPIGGKKRLFREIVLRLKGDLRNVSSNNFLEFKKIVESQKSKKQEMSVANIILIKEKKCVILSRITKKKKGS